MATITWRPGAPVYGMMTADDGAPYDLTGSEVWLSVQVADACLIVPGEIVDARMGLVGFDPTALGLRLRAYRATAHVRWADGREEPVHPGFVLNIEEGC